MTEDIKAPKAAKSKSKAVLDESDDDAATPTASDGLPDVAVVPTMTRKELIERVTADGTIKKKDARDAIDATLRVIAEALKSGEELNLPHLGKVRVNRTKDSGKAKIIIARLRIPNSEAVISLAPPLADDTL